MQNPGHLMYAKSVYGIFQLNNFFYFLCDSVAKSQDANSTFETPIQINRTLYALPESVTKSTWKKGHINPVFLPHFSHTNYRQIKISPHCKTNQTHTHPFIFWHNIHSYISGHDSKFCSFLLKIHNFWDTIISYCVLWKSVHKSSAFT